MASRTALRSPPRPPCVGARAPRDGPRRARDDAAGPGGGPPLLVGSEAHVADRLHAFREAGVQGFSLVLAGSDPLLQVEHWATVRQQLGFAPTAERAA